MKHLIFTLLALVSFTTLSAQDHTEYIVIQRNHYTADNFAEARKAQEKMAELYRANGADLPVATYVFDDNTLEFVYDVNSYAAIDRIQDAYDAAGIRIGKARMDETLPKRLQATNREFLIGRTVDALSYVPEGVDLDEMKFIRVLRARIKPDDYEEFHTVAAEEAELAKKQNRQTPYVLQIFPMGYGLREFEVIEFGRDRADFERREAASKKTHYSTKEYKAWEKKRDAVAEVISVRNGVLHEKLSRLPDAKEEEEMLLLIDELPIANGKLDAAWKSWDVYRELSKQYHYPQRQTIGLTADESLMMRFTRVRDFADLERYMSSNRQMGYVPQSANDKMAKSREGVYAGWDQYVLQKNKSLSYEREQDESDETKERSVWRLTEYEFPLDKRSEAFDLLKEIKAAYVAADSPIAYEVFNYALSGPRNRIFVVTYGKDTDELYRRRSDGNAALPKDKRMALNQRLDELMKVHRAMNGTTYWDRAYDPKKEVK